MTSPGTGPTTGVHDRRTTIEEGTHLKGSLVSKCAIEVKGHIEGEVTAPALLVAATGAVHGRVKVGEIRSQGELAGEFDANVVQLSGVVRDSTVIRAKSLEVKLATPEGKMQVVFGECSLEVGAESPPLDAQVRAPAVRTVSVRPPPPTDANGH
jgi:cytoskeletal protein CcmA (bactofilin family)